MYVCVKVMTPIRPGKTSLFTLMQRGLVNLESVTFTIEPHQQVVFSQTARGSVWTHRVERHANFADVSATECATTGNWSCFCVSANNGYSAAIWFLTLLGIC